MSFNGNKNANNAALQPGESNNYYINAHKHTTFTPTKAAMSPATLRPSSAAALTPSSALVNLTKNAENKPHYHTSSCSFIYIPPPPLVSDSGSVSNFSSISSNSLNVHTLDVNELQNQQKQENSNSNIRQKPHQSTTPTLSTDLKLNYTTHEYTSNNGVPHGHYRHTLHPLDDHFKLFTIYGNASSEPDPGASGSGGDGGGHDPSSSEDENMALNQSGIKQEKWTSILLQVSIPFFLAGIGTIGAGIILGRSEKSNVFQAISELFILVPALLGLKGNLDMCLASRLSTQANLGNMTGKKEIIRMIIGNIALVQVQATVASFLVAMFAISVGAAMERSFNFEHLMLLTASAMFTATSSCFVLDFLLVALILFCQKYILNPDNLATPLAASIGDVVSIASLSFIATVLFDNIKTHLWITYIVVSCYLVLLPMWVTVVLKNKYARPVLKSGWVPVLSALCISGLGGLVLDAAVEVFHGFVVFQPIINGIGGNLVSVQASKISTMLHQSSIIGIIPPHTKILDWPWKALFKGVPYAKTARLLICLSIPGNILFIFVADYIHMSQSTITWEFTFSYLIASLIQLILLLYIAHIIVHSMWKWKIDPDNSSIPYLTALGDLLGSSLLALAFFFLLSVNQQYGA